MLFSFDAGGERVELSIRSPHPLNDDKWHRVEVEKNIQEATLQLDGQYREVRPTSSQGRTKLEFYSDLYIGETHSCKRAHSVMSLLAAPIGVIFKKMLIISSNLFLVSKNIFQN